METAKELLEKTASLKGSSPDLTAIRNRAMLNGGLIGMSAGFYIGYAKKKNILVTGLLGGVVGVIVSRVFQPK